MEYTGAEILLKSLEAEGVDTIFGYPGGAVLPIYDALYYSNIRHILTRHEQGAAHAADGYARVTGKPGVVLATSGPGATNLVTGIANAYMDSIPLIAITGQVATSLLGKDSFQESDITAITMPITKHNFLVKDIKQLAITIKKAFHIATTGRPGPVLIDIPKDISSGKYHFNYPSTIHMPSYKICQVGNYAQIQQAANAINEAKRPVIYAGGGVVAANAHRELLELAEITGMPVTNTLMGLGTFPGTHPQFMGMLGMHGTRAANYAVTECDLLVAIGTRFDDRVTSKLDTFATGAKIIHIDIDPAEISKNVKVDIPIVGHVKAVLEQLNKLVKRVELDHWIHQIYQWRKEFPLSYQDNGQLKPQYILEKIFELTRGEAIITTDVGQHQMWTALYYKFLNNRSLVTSGGLGTMGFGFPAAIGAQVALPDKTVINIAGDGSIQMNSQELATAVQYNIPVINVIMNNGYLGMVRQWQEIFYEKRYSYSDMEQGPDFVKLAEAYGAMGKRITTPAEVVPALEEAIASGKPYVLDFVIEREENVLPMVAPGQPIYNMVGR